MIIIIIIVIVIVNIQGKQPCLEYGRGKVMYWWRKRTPRPTSKVVFYMQACGDDSEFETSSRLKVGLKELSRQRI